MPGSSPGIPPPTLVSVRSEGYHSEQARDVLLPPHRYSVFGNSSSPITMFKPMAHLAQAQSNNTGSGIGNTGDYNTHGSFNNINMFMPPTGSMIDFGVRNQGSVPGAGAAAPRPYRTIPYCRNSRFIGRKSFLESVRGYTERKGHNRVALYGLGGSGKTQIALEYVYQRADEGNCNIFWVQGSGLSKFSEGFRAIAQHVQIPLHSAETDGEKLLEVKRWFEGPGSGTWILVIDNADNEADFATNDSPIARFIPQAANGTLIFTTRSRQVAVPQCPETIEVGKMEEEEARELFSKHFSGWESLEDKEKEDVAAILSSVHHLPLAVIGSAAYMAMTTTPPSVYWNIFRENEERMKDLLSWPFYGIQREAAHESVLSTYSATFAQIRQQMPLAADLLGLMAFFNHQNIPEELLTQYGPKGTDNPADFRGAIGKLLGFSLVTMVRCGCKDKIFYDLDHLVQLSLRKYLPTNELNQGRRAALKVISRLFPQSQDERGFIRPAYIPHALAATKNSTDPTAKELGIRVALYLLDMDSYDNAETQFHRCTVSERGAKSETVTRELT